MLPASMSRRGPGIFAVEGGTGAGDNEAARAGTALVVQAGALVTPTGVGRKGEGRKTMEVIATRAPLEVSLFV